MEITTRHILTGNLLEFIFFCKQVNKPPAWFKPVLTQKDVELIPVGATVILYGTYHLSKFYPIINQAWDAGNISTQVITPNEVAAEYDH